MGLDMYINNKDNPIDDEEIAYWRKHHNLHNAFHNLAMYKGMEFESFNCVPVQLERGDIDMVIKWLAPEDKDDYTMTTLAHCNFLIGTGAHLEYDSWW